MLYCIETFYLKCEYTATKKKYSHMEEYLVCPILFVDLVLFLLAFLIALISQEFYNHPLDLGVITMKENSILPRVSNVV